MISCCGLARADQRHNNYYPLSRFEAYIHTMKGMLFRNPIFEKNFLLNV